MANGSSSSVRITDGSTTFEGGIDSGRIPTIESVLNPNGLKRNQLSWLTSATVRGGGINCRTGWVKRCVVAEQPALYQGGYMYEPDFDFPYLMLNISGHTVQVRVDTDYAVNDVSNGRFFPADGIQHWFAQGEQFLVMQDGVNDPLVWDGSTLKFITEFVGINPLPPGQSMDYYMGRLWVANGREYLAGDIVRGPSGTAQYGLRDAILHMTENTYLAGGGKFIVPTVAGNIRALAHTANLDTALGEGRLFIFTRKTIYACNVTPTRAQWSTLTEPIQTVVQRQFGTTSDRSIVPVNGDLFYQSVDGVRSLLLAIREFDQYANIPISREMARILRFNDRSLLRFGTGINFDNRLLQSVAPVQTPAGVVHKAVMALDFDLISNMGTRLPPVWEGIYEGLDILQMFVGDFGGRERAFAVVVSRITGDIEIWEFTTSERFDEDDRRIFWYFETPAYTWGNSFSLKKLDSAEIWFDKIFGKVNVTIDYRVDQNPCWIRWHAFEVCSARTSCETIEHPVCYPEQPFCEGYKATVTLPQPPVECVDSQGRPSNIGYQYQLRVTIHGWCRVRGLLVHALPIEKQPFLNMTC
jgi:hypothetical protein